MNIFSPSEVKYGFPNLHRLDYFDSLAFRLAFKLEFIFYNFLAKILRRAHFYSIENLLTRARGFVVIFSM